MRYSNTNGAWSSSACLSVRSTGFAVLRVHAADEVVVAGREAARGSPWIRYSSSDQASSSEGMCHSQLPMCATPCASPSSATSRSLRWRSSATRKPATVSVVASSIQLSAGSGCVAVCRHCAGKAGEADEQRHERVPQLEEVVRGQHRPEVDGRVRGAGVGAARVDEQGDQQRAESGEQPEQPQRDALEADHHQGRDAVRDQGRRDEAGNPPVGIVREQQGQQRDRRPDAVQVREGLRHHDGAGRREQAAHAPPQPAQHLQEGRAPAAASGPS